MISIVGSVFFIFFLAFLFSLKADDSKFIKFIILSFLMILTLGINIKEYQNSGIYRGMHNQMIDNEYDNLEKDWRDKYLNGEQISKENLEPLTIDELMERPISSDVELGYENIFMSMFYWLMMCLMCGQIFIYGFNRPSVKLKFINNLFHKSLDFKHDLVTILVYGYFYFQLLTYISSIIDISSYVSLGTGFFLGIATLIFGFYSELQENKYEKNKP